MLTVRKSRFPDGDVNLTLHNCRILQCMGVLVNARHMCTRVILLRLFVCLSVCYQSPGFFYVYYTCMAYKDTLKPNGEFPCLGYIGGKRRYMSIQRHV